MSFHIPMFGYALLSFLLIAAVVAVALFFAFKSGEQGRTKLSGFAGCWIAFALLVIALLGAIGLIVVCVANVPSEMVKRGPVKSFEFQWDDTTPAPDEKRPAKSLLETDEGARPRLVIELKDGVVAAQIVKWIRDNVEGDLAISSEEITKDDGTKSARVTLSVNLSSSDRADLKKAKRDLEEALPGLHVPDGAKIELRDADE